MPRKPARDLTGETFGRLTVLGKSSEQDNSHHYKWKVRCSCGTVKEVSAHGLTTGRTKSCGCWAREYQKLAGAEMRAWFDAQAGRKKEEDQ